MCLLRAFAALDRYLAAHRTDRGFISHKYLIGEYTEYDAKYMTHVPEDCIYVEEWVKDGETRLRIIYELEEITPYIGNPFDPIKTPWNWIGDASTDVDITAALDRYLMPGNEIRLDLLFFFLVAHDGIDIRYTDPSSGELRLFPNKGVRIVKNGSA